MFSGIIEARSPITKSLLGDEVVRIQLSRPKNFNDIKVGDSICVNGICLTLENFTEDSLWFALGAETLTVTNWKSIDLLGMKMNLERSLKWGDRIHGHFVTGHVDQLSEVVETRKEGENLIVSIKVSTENQVYVWKKGSICLNGVSLTINSFDGGVMSCCLIPQTLKETNLSEICVGQKINVEFDYMARRLAAFDNGNDDEYIIANDQNIFRQFVANDNDNECATVNDQNIFQQELQKEQQ